jgi:hypothetical protein
MDFEKIHPEVSASLKQMTASKEATHASRAMTASKKSIQKFQAHPI